jgi:hypothetical protein
LSGNVGIDISNPTARLDVNGAAHFAGGGAVPADQGAYINWNRLTGGTGETDLINNEGGGSGGFAFMLANSAGTVTSTPMFINGSGNVGVNTTSPATTLDVSGEVSSTLTNLSQFRAVSGSYGAMIRNDGSNTYFLHTAAGSPYGTWNGDRQILLPDNSDNVYLSGNNGDVGINTTSPATTLDVNGPVRAAQQTAGAACSTVGAMGHDANGNLLSCGSTGVWGSASTSTGVTGWVVVNASGCANGGSPNMSFGPDGTTCNSTNSPTQICVNAGYTDITGGCKAGGNNGFLIQGGLVGWGSPGAWQLACNCTLGGYCFGAVGIQIQCTH